MTEKPRDIFADGGNGKGAADAGASAAGRSGGVESPGRPVPPAVLLFRGRGLVSAAIRWQSRSPYSHAALLMPDGRIVEAWQGAGVRTKELADWSDVEAYDVPDMTPADWRWALDFALEQVGQGYDYMGVLRFVSRRNKPDNGRWFCSELVFAALSHAGVDLLARVPAANVSPGMLALSPLLTKRSLPVFSVQPSAGEEGGA